MKLFALFSLGLLLAVESAPVTTRDPVDYLKLLSVSQDPAEMDAAVQVMLENEKILMENNFPKAKKEEDDALKTLAGILRGDVETQFAEKQKNPEKYRQNKESYTGKPAQAWQMRELDGSGDDGSGVNGSGSNGSSTNGTF